MRIIGPSGYIDLRDVLDAAGEGDQEAVSFARAVIHDLSLDGIQGLKDYAENEPSVIGEYVWLDYVRELAEDIGAVDRDADWPLNRIDWQAAADDLAMDYSTVTYDGHDYYIRTY